jgi:predicted AAA+ superfamily ATPase
MPHQRKRALLALISKRLRLFPVVGVLGARQTGKSTLLRELLPATRKVRYVTLDREENRQQAIRSPTLFVQSLESSGTQTVCIDEIQKAPSLFDTLKAEVDENKRPGRFAVSGSTEFSRKTGFRDSLTGRIALLRMFPLNLGEIEGGVSASFPITDFKPTVRPRCSLKSIQSWMVRGGMPGIFAVREESNREALWDAWIETTCSRDLAQFGIPRFNPELARRILQSACSCEIPTRIEIAKRVGKTSRQVQSYLDAFQSLFVLYEIPSHPSGTGKPRYFPFDPGIAGRLGSTEKRRLQVWFLNECLSQFSYSGRSRPDLFFYASSKGSQVDFVVETPKKRMAVALSLEESPSTYSWRALEAFRKRNPNIPAFMASPCLETHSVRPGMTIVPWTKWV